MKNTMSAITAVAFGTCVAIATSAHAEKMTMKVPLTGASEVPPNTSAGKGVADVTYDTDSKLLTWKITYADLTGPAIMAHFHSPAVPGQNAPPTVPLKDVASGAEGSATLTDAQAADLMSGKMYFNVHTEANKGGEIRGQVVK